MTDNIEHTNSADLSAIESETIVESGVNQEFNSVEHIFDSSSDSDDIENILNGLQYDSSGEDELPNVALTDSVDTTSSVDDNDVDFSFINEENHYSMHKTIRDLICSKRIDTSNSQLLFDALNEYYSKFCQKLNTTTTNTKYYGFKFPTEKPKKLSESSIINYISKYYSIEELNSVKSCIYTFLENDVLRCNSVNRTYSENIGQSIVLVKVKEYPNLVVTNSELEHLNNYTMLNNAKTDRHHTLNCPIINDYTVFKSIKNKDDINANKIIRYQYITLDRRLCYSVLARITDANNKSEFVRDLKRIYNFQHDSAKYPKPFNFKIFDHSEEKIKIIRNVFEYLTFSEELDSNNSEYSLISPTNRVNRQAHNQFAIYFIGNDCYHYYGYGYGYSYNDNQDSSSLRLQIKTLDYTSIESKIWITSSSLDDITLNDVLPLIFLIKANIDLKSTIYDKSSLCYVNNSTNALSEIKTT